LIGYISAHQTELWPEEADDDQIEDFLDEDILNAVEKLDPDNFDIDRILDDTFDDLNQLAEFLDLLSDAKPERDDKIKALIKLLKTDSVLKKRLVSKFSEAILMTSLPFGLITR
jgi:hypothetical protein